MGREEQVEEREVLDSIFPDEITDISESEYRISIKLEPPSTGGDEESEVIILLSVSLPEAYPDVAPHLEIMSAPGSSKHEFFDVTSDRGRLLASLEPTIAENVGIQMIFTVVTTLKELAEDMITTRIQHAEKEQEQEAARLEEAENAKFMGEKVTPESFMKWRNEFMAEMAAKEAKEAELALEESKRKKGGAAAVAKSEERLTGRQLWERGLVGKVDEDDYDDAPMPLEGQVAGLSVAN